MNTQTKQALIEVREAVTGAENFVTAARNEIHAVEDNEKFSKPDAAFLRSRIEGIIENARKALVQIPEGEE